MQQCSWYPTFQRLSVLPSVTQLDIVLTHFVAEQVSCPIREWSIQGAGVYSGSHLSHSDCCLPCWTIQVDGCHFFHCFIFAVCCWNIVTRLQGNSICKYNCELCNFLPQPMMTEAETIPTTGYQLHYHIADNPARLLTIQSEWKFQIRYCFPIFIIVFCLCFSDWWTVVRNSVKWHWP